MDDPNKIRKLLHKIMTEDPETLLSQEEIVFEVEVMKSLEFVGDRWVLWRN